MRWVVDKVPDLRDIEECRAVVVDYRKDALRAYNLLEDSVPIENELLKLEKKLKAENLSDSEKQILCNQAERLLEKLDGIFAEFLQIMKTESCPQGFVKLLSRPDQAVQAQQGLWRSNIVSVIYIGW